MSKKAVFLTKCFVLDAESKKVVFFKKNFWIENFPKFSVLEGNNIFLLNFWTLKNDKSLIYWAETDQNWNIWHLRLWVKIWSILTNFLPSMTNPSKMAIFGKKRQVVPFGYLTFGPFFWPFYRLNEQKMRFFQKMLRVGRWVKKNRFFWKKF